MSYAHLGLKLLQAPNSMMGVGLHEVDKPAATTLNSAAPWAVGGLQTIKELQLMRQSCETKHAVEDCALLKVGRSIVKECGLQLLYALVYGSLVLR